MKTLLKHICLTGVLGLTALNAMADVTIENAYVRAVPPGQMMSASFMSISNSAPKSVFLISGSSPIANNVELHTHTNNNGVMQMRQVDNIEIPANGYTSLQPGGLHIMLLGLQQDLVEGDEITLTLKFSDGSEQSLNIPVKKVMAGMQHHEHNHEHP